jgi:hypothetical protein
MKSCEGSSKRWFFLGQALCLPEAHGLPQRIRVSVFDPGIGWSGWWVCQLTANVLSYMCGQSVCQAADVAPALLRQLCCASSVAPALLERPPFTRANADA